MITREDDVDAHALHRRGWTISAIARHLGHDRKTIRAYLSGSRVAGRRARTEADPVRAVRRLLPGTAGRGPAPVGDHAVRRVARAGLPALLPDVHPPAAGPRVASGVRAVPPGP